MAGDGKRGGGGDGTSWTGYIRCVTHIRLVTSRWSQLLSLSEEKSAFDPTKRSAASKKLNTTKKDTNDQNDIKQQQETNRSSSSSKLLELGMIKYEQKHFRRVTKKNRQQRPTTTTTTTTPRPTSTGLWSPSSPRACSPSSQSG